METSNMISKAPSRFKNFFTIEAVKLQSLYMVGFYMTLHIGNIFGYFATFIALPNR